MFECDVDEMVRGDLRGMLLLLLLWLLVLPLLSEPLSVNADLKMVAVCVCVDLMAVSNLLG